MGARIAVIGSTNVDLFARVPHHPQPGETVLGSGGDHAPGGKGANQALAARLQGGEVSFVGAVGADNNATVATERLRQAGVDLRHLAAQEDTATGMAIITVAEGGENSIVVIPGANASVTPAAAEAAIHALSAEDIVLLQGELPRETTEAAIRLAAEHGNRVVLNLAPWGPLDPDVLRLVDPLVVNEHEAASVATALSLEVSDDPSELAAELLGAGVRSVVLTLGAHGAIAADDSGVHSLPAPAVRAVDTTGAGDAFTGGLLARLATGDGLVAASTHAVRVGSYAAQHPGAQPSYPDGDAQLPDAPTEN